MVFTSMLRSPATGPYIASSELLGRLRVAQVSAKRLEPELRPRLYRLGLVWGVDDMPTGQKGTRKGTIASESVKAMVT